MRGLPLYQPGGRRRTSGGNRCTRRSLVGTMRLLEQPRILGLFLLLTCAGCGWQGTGHVASYVEGEGDRLCLELSEQLQQTSSRWALAGWLAGFAGTVLTALG